MIGAGVQTPDHSSKFIRLTNSPFIIDGIDHLGWIDRDSTVIKFEKVIDRWEWTPGEVKEEFGVIFRGVYEQFGMLFDL